MTRGECGERLAADFLKRLGYEIAERNFRTRFGEIDLIARKGKFTVFVEVKLRANTRFGTPAEAVTRAKQERLILAAEEWLAAHKEAVYARFDVIEVMLPKDGEMKINHLENAFEA